MEKELEKIEKVEVSKKDYFMKEILPYIIILVIVILVRTYLVTPVRVNGASMDKTLKDGEIMILNKIGHLDRGDIVVVDTGDEKIIKRIVGLPGEVVEGKNGNVYIDNKLYEEKYVSSRMGDFTKTKVNEGEYFVLGDNRFVSKDSRFFGPISEEKILGTTNLVIFPFNKMGKVK